MKRTVFESLNGDKILNKQFVIKNETMFKISVQLSDKSATVMFFFQYNFELL